MSGRENLEVSEPFEALDVKFPAPRRENVDGELGCRVSFLGERAAPGTQNVQGKAGGMLDSRLLTRFQTPTTLYLIRKASSK